MSGIETVRSSSIYVDEGGKSEELVVDTAGIQSAAIEDSEVLVTCTIDVFVRQGENPTATNDGTDIFLIGNSVYRLAGIKHGNKLAFKALAGSGSIYITSGA